MIKKLKIKFILLSALSLFLLLFLIIAGMNLLNYNAVVSEADEILSLTRQNRTLLLTVSNPTQMEFTLEALRRVFDRFYRTDPSRNSETGGHGIGLSIAKAIVTAHGGKISAASPDGHAFQITATLPI